MDHINTQAARNAMIQGILHAYYEALEEDGSPSEDCLTLADAALTSLTAAGFVIERVKLGEVASPISRK